MSIAPERATNASTDLMSAESIVDVLETLRSKGVDLWEENGELRYRAPKGRLNYDDFETLKRTKSQVIAHLRNAVRIDVSAGTTGHRTRLACVPLSFSQLSHLKLYGLNERPAIRQIASATRLQGKLDVEVLRKSLTAVVTRHEALRTRILLVDDARMQVIDEPSDFVLDVKDLSSIASSQQEAEISRSIEEIILEPIDLAVGPLFGTQLLRLQENDYVLLIAMEHMVSDMASMHILIRDLFSIYAATLNGDRPSLPDIALNFARHAAWQQSSQRAFVEKHGRYWREHLSGCPRARFPEDKARPPRHRMGWGTAPIRIDAEQKKALREWCRVRQTTLVLGVLTAYVGAVLRWCDTWEAVFQYITDGRVESQIKDSIGYFAAPLYLRLALDAGQNFVELLESIRQEYCGANEHADLSYLESQTPRPEFARNSAFNWIPPGATFDFPRITAPENALTCTSIPFSHPMEKNLERDNEPSVLLFDQNDEIVGAIHFPLNRFSQETMEDFVRNFMLFIEHMLKTPRMTVHSIRLI